MKAGTEDRKKLIFAGVAGFFAIFALGYIYLELFGGPSAPPPHPVAPVIRTVDGPGGEGATASIPSQTQPVAGNGTKAVPGNAATKIGSVSAQLDPTLHPEAMEATESLVYRGSGRNIFAAGPTPMEIAAVEKAKFDARPKPQTVAYTAPVQTGPPPKPPINLKFFGTATQDGKKRALLLAGEDVFLASPGDIVARRYKIVSIAANSITVEDVPNSNSQNLPLVAN